MKKIKLLLIFSIVVFLSGMFNIKTNSSDTLVPLKNEKGTTLYYRNSQTPVMIPNEYIAPERELRAVWVSRYVSDIGNITSESLFKQNFTTVLNQMEQFNLNTIIFHVRTHHDAFYRSSLNKQSRYVGSVNQNFDAIKWAIEESHKRGIEFHAWLNPYRIKSSGTTYQDLVNEYKDFPDNPVHNPDNVLITSDRAILNPGEPAVREFLIDTVMELIENYDVDAIHFDDYFYSSGINDTSTRNKPGYNPNGLSVDNWRREQVDIFIRDLSQTMREYNIQNNRFVQLGIAPTGIYRNGNPGPEGGASNYDSNGNFITSGSNTAGQEHYQSYLYADTKKWIDNEWIDYIMPQVYWSFERSVARYADIVDWWEKVVRNKNVNLYIGHGFYMSNSQTEQGWSSNPYEAANQIRYNTKHEHVRGSSIYKLATITGANSRLQTSLDIIMDQMWNKKALRPVIRTLVRDPLGKVQNAKIDQMGDSNMLTWDNLEGARGYVIYRSKDNIDFNNNDQIYDIIGFDGSQHPSFEDIVTEEGYNYGIRAIDGANQLGDGTLLGVSSIRYNTSVSDNVNSSLLSVQNSYSKIGELNRVYVNYSNPYYRFMFLTEGGKIISTNNEYEFYTSQNTLYKGYFVSNSKIGVAFVDGNNDLIKFQEVANASEIEAPNVLENKQGYRFSHWSYPFDKVTKDTIIKAVYVKDDVETFTVTIFDGSTTTTKEVTYGSKLMLAPASEFKSSFNHWKINGQLSSFKENYQISVYQDLNIVASDAYLPNSPIAYIFDKGVKTGEGVAFVGSYYLPSDAQLLEVGMLLVNSSITNFDFDTTDVIRVKALKVSNNNEFSIIKRTVELGKTVNAKTYLMYMQNGEVHTILSGVSQFSNTSEDYETLQTIISQVPTHITDDYSFPTYPGLTWNYASGQDESLFDLNTGKLLIQRITQQTRVIEANYQGMTTTIEINFGVLQPDEVGKFYYGDPYSISQNEPQSDARNLGWSGYTLKRGNEVHFITQAIELDVDGMITDPDVLYPERGSGSLGTLYINVGNKSLSFTLSSLGSRIDGADVSAISPVIVIGEDGDIINRYNNKTPRDTIITLAPQQSLWIGKYLDRSNGVNFGLESDFTGVSNIKVQKYHVK